MGKTMPIAIILRALEIVPLRQCSEISFFLGKLFRYVFWAQSRCIQANQFPRILLEKITRILPGCHENHSYSQYLGIEELHPSEL